MRKESKYSDLTEGEVANLCAQPFKMKVKLSSCGNPDFGQNPDEPLWGCPDEVYAHVATFEGASELCMRYINRWELGGGNWSGGQVYEDDKQIARVSYNGRIWNMNDEEIKIRRIK